jgi:hypothetical protein
MSGIHDHYNAQINTASMLLDAIAQQLDLMPDTSKGDHVGHAHLGKMIELSLTLSRASHDMHKFLDFIRRGEKDEYSRFSRCSRRAGGVGVVGDTSP